MENIDLSDTDNTELKLSDISDQHQHSHQHSQIGRVSNTDNDEQLNVIVKEYPIFRINSFSEDDTKSRNCCQSKIHHCLKRKKDCHSYCKVMYWVCQWICCCK